MNWTLTISPWFGFLWLHCNKKSTYYKRLLRIACGHYCSSFEELLDKNGAVMIHQRNVRVLATEMYEISNRLSPIFMVQMMSELDILCHTRSSCRTKLDIDGNITDVSKNWSTNMTKWAQLYRIKSIRWLGAKIELWSLKTLKKLCHLTSFKQNERILF